MIPLSHVPRPNAHAPEFPDALTLQAWVDEILKGRKICRSPMIQEGSSSLHDELEENQSAGRANSSLDGGAQRSFSQLQQQIFQRLRLQVLEIVTVEGPLLHPETPEQWAKQVRDRAYRSVLDEETLTQMAIAIQQYPADSKDRRRGASELVMAVQLADRFSLRLRRSPHYHDALNRTLTHVYEKLDQYDPNKGLLMAWVNYWLDIFGRRVQTERDDPLIQSSMAKIIRERNKLRAILRSVARDDVLDWVEITIKQIGESLYLIILKNLIICFLWGRYLKKNRTKMDAYLFDLAQQSLGIPSKISTVDHQDMALDRVPASDAPTFLSDDLRHYLATDPERLLQKHIQGQPAATFQAIALAYLEGTSWQTLSARWGVPIPSLSSFFQRQLKVLAPTLKAHLQQ